MSDDGKRNRAPRHASSDKTLSRDSWKIFQMMAAFVDGFDKLATIAPRRFNPTGESWLPVLHTSRGDWHVTALYSNTARAHELGRTRDWVVLYLAAGRRHNAQFPVSSSQDPTGPSAIG